MGWIHKNLDDYEKALEARDGKLMRKIAAEHIEHATKGNNLLKLLENDYMGYYEILGSLYGPANESNKGWAIYGTNPIPENHATETKKKLTELKAKIKRIEVFTKRLFSEEKRLV